MKRNLLVMLSIVAMLLAFISCTNDNSSGLPDTEASAVAEKIDPVQLMNDALAGKVDGATVKFRQAKDVATLIAVVEFKDATYNGFMISTGRLSYTLTGNLTGSSFRATSYAVTTEVELSISEASTGATATTVSIEVPETTTTSTGSTVTATVTTDTEGEVTVSVSNVSISLPSSGAQVTVGGNDVTETIDPEPDDREPEVVNNWPIRVSIGKHPSYEANAKLSSASYSNRIITVTTTLDDLDSYPSDDPSQEGDAKWIGLLISVDGVDIKSVSYGDHDIGDADVAEAIGAGGTEDDFVLWIRAEEVLTTPKTFTLSRAGVEDITITVNVIDQGSESHPIEIDASNFNILGESKSNLHYVLTSDITLPKSAGIEEFYGVFNGNGHTISFSDSSADTEMPTLFGVLYNGARIENLSIDYGDNSSFIKPLSFGCAGTVVIDDVTIDGTVVAKENNTAPFVVYLGYDYTDTPFDLTLSNCVNSVDIEDSTNTHWGIGPFISGPKYLHDDVLAESSVTITDCHNEGIISGGQVGWAFGNNDGVSSLNKITISGCSNRKGGSVTGYISAGAIAYDGDASLTKYDNADVDDSFTDASMVNDLGSAMNGSTASYTAEGAVTVNFSSSLPTITSAKVIGRYFIEAFADEACMKKLGHMTYSIVLAEAETSGSSSLSMQMGAVNAVDDEYEGITGPLKTGTIITIGDQHYVYVGDMIQDWGTVHSCLDKGKTHTSDPSSVFVILYDGDEAVGSIKATLAN